jgi:hypothetical protein
MEAQSEGEGGCYSLQPQAHLPSGVVYLRITLSSLDPQSSIQDLTHCYQ